MLSGFDVTPDEVKRASDTCLLQAGVIEAQLSALRQYVFEVEGTYHGVAANTFSSLMASYDIYAKKLHQSLVDIGDGLRGNYVNYTNAEEQAVANLIPIHNDIPGANL